MGGEAINTESIIQDRTNEGAVKGEQNFPIASGGRVCQIFENVQRPEVLGFDFFDMWKSRMASVKTEAQDLDCVGNWDLDGVK